MNIKEVTIWHRECPHRGASVSIGAYRLDENYCVEGDLVKGQIVFIPGPSCDECGKPWKAMPVTEMEEAEE